MTNFDFLVIGSGPAGQRAAIQAAKVGKRVAIFEQRAVVGGVSVHTGTIPSKTLREAALYLTGANQRGFYGRGYRLKKKVTMEDLLERLTITLQHEIEVIQDQLSRNNVNVFQGNARFIDAHTIELQSEDGTRTRYTGSKILIATGTKPIRPADICFNERNIIDSDGVLQMHNTPKSMTIVGGGVIGVEYASIFSTMDIRVTLIDGRKSLMSFLDREIIDELVHYMRDHAVSLRLGETVAKVEEIDNQVFTTLASGKKIRSDLILFAAGRIGCTDGLMLENAGVNADDKGRISVNNHFQTETPNIYAAGDVIGFPSLASTSMEQGRRAACHAFAVCETGNLTNFPIGVYAVPEISMVGMTEDELTEKNIPYEAGIARLRETARGQIMGLETGLLKLLVSLQTRKILGVHIIGEGATELIHIGQAVIALNGTIDYFLEHAFNYPTLAEAYKVAALDAWNRIGVRPASVAVA